MSSFLEFRHLALAIPAALALDAVRLGLPDAPGFDAWESDSDRYLVFTEGGDNNVIDHSRSRRGRVSRRWYLMATGTHDEVMQNVTRSAADHVIDGNVCLQTRTRWTLPENYIRAYRDALAHAVSWKDACDVAPHLRLRVDLPSEEAGFARPWPARAAYTEALRATGRLQVNGVSRAAVTAALASHAGLADLAWLSTWGNANRAPAQLHRDHDTNHAIDRLAEFAKRHRKLSARGAA